MGDLDRIVRCAIHPAIGIARVGNAPDEGFYGPEAPGRRVDAGGSFKDPEGRVRRQAARFRVYGFDSDGKVVAELNAGNARVAWRVHLANRKAAWYAFGNAMDLGAIALTETPRNPSITGEARQKLVIESGPRQIEGRGISGEQYRFDGNFLSMPNPIYLGELRTDGDGRLVVLGGLGASASVDGSPAVTFANNDGWHDDVSDGPVRATVTVGGRELEADPAMVAVVPPNFVPGLSGVVTMYEVVGNLFEREFGWRRPGDDGAVQFWRDIHPFLARVSAAQAVNAGIYLLYGAGSPMDFSQPALLCQLADPSPRAAAIREAVFGVLRAPIAETLDGQSLVDWEARTPAFYGDAFDEYPNDTRATLPLTPTMYQRFRRWAAGDFTPGAPPANPPPDLASLPLDEQPHALDRANLEDCLGGPFHPGIELTWTMRLKSMWREPFRLNLLPEGVAPRDDWGPSLLPADALATDGPFAGNGPGTLTRLMGVPWQTDEASCEAGYEAGTYLPLPSFWAPRVPNHVLQHRSYQRLCDTTAPLAQRLKHLAQRPAWLRFFPSVYQKHINAMVANWSRVGIVAEQPAPVDHAAVGLPPSLWVETEVNPSFTILDPTWEQVLYAEQFPAPRPRPVGVEGEAARLRKSARIRRRRDER